jgi:hypothetical protein
MTTEMGLASFGLMAFLIATCCVSLLTRLFQSRLSGWLDGIPPAARANYWLALAVLPVMTGLLSLILMLFPFLMHLWGITEDHSHPSNILYWVYKPWFTGSGLEWLLLFGTGSVAVGTVIRTFRHLNQSRQSLDALLALARQTSAGMPFKTIDTRRPFAITAGLLRPQVLVSTRLLASLGPAELAAVVNHELAHRQRRDGIRLLIAECLSVMHLPATRRQILADLNLAIERACDEVAAQRSDDRLQVAATILKITRLVGEEPPLPWALGPSVTGSVAMLRVEGLLRPASAARRGRGIGLFLGGLLLLILTLAASDWWHHTVESFLNLNLV